MTSVATTRRQNLTRPRGRVLVRLVVTGQDRAPRTESYMKDFRPVVLGTVHLEAGRAPLTLRATKIARGQVMDFRSLTLTLKSP